MWDLIVPAMLATFTDSEQAVSLAEAPDSVFCMLASPPMVNEVRYGHETALKAQEPWQTFTKHHTTL